MVLNEHGQSVVAAILSGERSHKDLKLAFDWEATSEGHAYWSAVRQAPGLSDEARHKLANAVHRARMVEKIAA